MDIQSLKGKTLDDELVKQLAAHVESLATRAETAEGKARTAQKETIEGRKQLKAERDAAFDKLGVSTLDELQALPDAKGQADAVKQVEAQLKKLEREKLEAVTQLQEVQGKYAKDRLDLAIEKAIASQPFIDAEDARAVLERRLKAEGDDFLYETPEGKLVPLGDGAAFIAKTKTHLVRAPGQGKGGSGFKAGGQGGNAGPNPFAKATLNVTEQVRLSRENPEQAAALKAAAAPA